MAEVFDPEDRNHQDVLAFLKKLTWEKHLQTFLEAGVTSLALVCEMNKELALQVVPTKGDFHINLLLREAVILKKEHLAREAKRQKQEQELQVQLVDRREQREPRPQVQHLQQRAEFEPSSLVAVQQPQHVPVIMINTAPSPKPGIENLVLASEAELFHEQKQEPSPLPLNIELAVVSPSPKPLVLESVESGDCLPPSLPLPEQPEAEPELKVDVKLEPEAHAHVESALLQEQAAREKCLNEFLRSVNKLRTTSYPDKPPGRKMHLFISYAWYKPGSPENNALQALLRRIKDSLKLLDFDVFLDCTGDMHGNIKQKMANAMNEAQHVLLIGTSQAQTRSLHVGKEPNNLQWEYSFAAAKVRESSQVSSGPPFTLCLLLAGTTSTAFPATINSEYPPTALTFKYKLPLATDQFDMRDDDKFASSIVDLVTRIRFRMATDLRFQLSRELVRYELCGLSCGKLESPMDLEKALSLFAQDLGVQITADKKEHPLKQLPFVVSHVMGNKKSPEVLQRMKLITDFLRCIGVKVAGLPMPQDGATNTFLLLGGNGQPDAEVTRIISKTTNLVPVILEGEPATSFPDCDLFKILMLDFTDPAKFAWKPLLCQLFAWDVDNDMYFEIALRLFEARTCRRLCEMCTKNDSIRHRGDPEPIVEKQEENQAGAQEQESQSDAEVKTIWELLQSKVEELKLLSLMDLRALKPQDVESVVGTMPPLLKPKMRRLLQLLFLS